MSTKSLRRPAALIAGLAAAAALAVPAGAADRPEPGPGVAKDRIEHTVVEVKVSGSKAAASHTRIEQWLTSDRLRTVTRDAKTGKLVSEVVVSRRGTRIYDAAERDVTRTKSSRLPQLSRDQEAAIIRAQLADGSLRVAEDRGDQLVLESVPGKWESDEPGSKATIVVDEQTMRVVDRISELPGGVFTQHVDVVIDESFARTTGNERLFRPAFRGRGR